MTITKLKKTNSIVIDLKDSKIVWLVDAVSDPKMIIPTLPVDTSFVLINPEKPLNAQEFIEWDLVAQELKKERNVVLIFTPGEYEINGVHMRGSGLDSSVHYILETPDATVGIFASTPSDSFIKQYSPIDVLIGRDASLATVQLDLEPFVVVLPSPSEEYAKKSGISEIKEVEKVSVKKIEPAARESTVTMTVYALI